MASASPQPEELANVLFGALRVFTDGSLTQGAAAEGMERAFGLLGQVKRLSRQNKVQCVWKLSQLGAFPLVTAMLDPKSATFSLGCTTLGVCLEDEDLLSHRIGKTLTREPRFLEAIDTGLTPIASGRPDTAFLVAQMVNNVLKTASLPMISQVAHFGNVVNSLVAVIEQASKSLWTLDWRHPFVVADTLFLMEAGGNCIDCLDAAGVGETAITLFLHVEEEGSMVGDVLRQKDHLLHRVAAISLLWLMRKKIVPDELLQRCAKVAKSLSGEAVSSEGKGAHSLSHITAALFEFAQGDTELADTCKDALVARIKDWAAIEQAAVAKVRSPEFAATIQTEHGAMGEQRVASTLHIRAEGNASFKAGDYTAALKHYQKAIDLYEEQQCKGGEVAESADIEQAKIWGNMAECYLRLKQFENAIEAATDATDADPQNVKSWYRRARAYAALSQIEAAKADVLQLSALKPMAAVELIQKIAEDEGADVAAALSTSSGAESSE